MKMIKLQTHHLDCQKLARKIGGQYEAIFDTPFIIQSHAVSVKKIVGAVSDLSAK